MNGSWPSRTCPSRWPRSRPRRKHAQPKRRAGRPAPAPRRTIGNLPATLLCIEEVIEPDSLIWSLLGAPLVRATMATRLRCHAQDRRRPLRAPGHRAGAVARHRHPAPEICLPDLHRRGDAGRAIEGAIGSSRMASAPSHLIAGGLPTEATLAHVLAKPSMRTICRYTAKARSWRGRASICTAPCWPIGSARAPPEARGGPAGRASETIGAKLFMDETIAPVLAPGRGTDKDRISLGAGPR